MPHKLNNQTIQNLEILPRDALLRALSHLISKYLLFTSELANQNVQKALFTCVVYAY